MASGNVSIHGIDSQANLDNGKVKWVPVQVRSDGSVLVYGPGSDSTNGVTHIEERYIPQVVPVTTATTLGATGAVGDVLHKIHADEATTTITIKDGATTKYVWDRTGVAAGSEHVMEFNWESVEGAWELTCVTDGCTASGRFTA